MKYLQILLCSKLQAKHFVIIQEENKEMNVVQFYLSQKKDSVELHVI